MIVRASDLSARAQIETHTCIVGGGPLGLLLANRLASAARPVIVLEAGGLMAQPEKKDLLLGEDLTGEYDNLQESRHCQLGGTVNIWNTPVNQQLGAKYVPLDASDFEHRSWVDQSGWPIVYDELVPYYRKAHVSCGLGPFLYGANEWSDPSLPPFPFTDDTFTSEVYQLAQGVPMLGNLIECARSNPHIKCVTEAAVKELIGEKGSPITSRARVAISANESFDISAQRFILASGGIENARLLLASQTQNPSGLGNEHDCVGRYYMDHPVYHFTEFIPRDPQLFARAGFYDMHQLHSTTLLGRIAPSAQTLRKEQLLNFSIALYPQIPHYRSRGVEAVRQLRILTRQKKWPAASRYLPAAMLHFRNLLAYQRQLRKTPALTGSHYWQKAAAAGTQYATFEPQFYLEQPPLSENRVTLSSQHDTLGRPRAAITWHWGKQSEDTAHRAAKLFDHTLRISGLGELRMLPNPRLVPSAHHHMGATRISSDPRNGVCNANARLHTNQNVYLAGSSLFPTAGYVNPTLTALALALRLSDHLETTD